MFIETCLIGICLLILLSIFFILLYLGYFNKVEIFTGTCPLKFSNSIFAYKSFHDTFSSISLHFNNLHNLIATKDKNLRNLFNKAIVVGIYYDDRTRNNNLCKFSIGLLLEGESNCEQIKEILEKENYIFSTLPQIDQAVYTSFPLKKKFSLPFATRSVYYKLSLFVKEKKIYTYPLIEFYTQDKIYFILPLNKQKEFVFHSTKNSDFSSTEDENSNETNSLSDENKHCKLHIPPGFKKILKKRSIRKNQLQDCNSSGSSFDEINLDENVN